MLDVGDNYPIVKPVKLYTLGEPWYKKTLKAFQARQYQLMEDYFLYVPERNLEFFVPKAFICNFASIPRIFWPIIPPDGLLLIPSVFHDFGYSYGGVICRYRNDASGFKGPWVFNRVTQKEMDEFFEYLGKEINDITVVPVAAYSALRAFGWIAWRKCRKENKNVFTDYPELNLI